MATVQGDAREEIPELQARQKGRSHSTGHAIGNGSIWTHYHQFKSSQRKRPGSPSHALKPQYCWCQLQGFLRLLP